MQYKKILSLTLALLMVFTTIVGAIGNEFYETVYEMTEEQNLISSKMESDNDFIKSTEGLYEDEDKVEIIVLLNEEQSFGTRSFESLSTNTYGYGLKYVKGFNEIYGDYLKNNDDSRSFAPQSTSRINNIVLDDKIERNLNRQINSLQNLYDLGFDFEILMNSDYILNLYALNTSYKTAKEISKLNFVEDVYINTQFAPIEPNMTTSNTLINSQYAWDSGFDGTGMLVAVIDSGTDYTHPDFQNIDIEKAKIKSEQELKQLMEEKNITRGKWFTEKVPFGYNYVENNNDIDEDINNPKISMHGQHVAGTAVANGLIKGVAPNAQLLGLRVFREGSGTSEIYYIQAIEDAVKLGVDAINMSLGSPIGASAGLRKGSMLDMALSRAIESGAVVSISAGNDAQFGGLNLSKVRSDNPDYGVTGAPSAFSYSLSVAAAGNTHQKLPYITVGDKKYSYHPTKTTEKAFNLTAKVIHVGKGVINEEENINDYEGKDVTGKIVLIERGGSTFVEKINTAEKQGAVAAMIYNHETGGNTFIGMIIDGTNLPSMSILRNDALEIQDDTEITINDAEEINLFPAPTAGDMGGFSSWGPTVDFELKPEIAAPGVDIYSTLYEGKYGSMEGTSMAAPHIAGAATIIKQRLMKDFPEYKGKELSILIKNMLMSTANPIKDKVTGSILSPRKQGAGLVNNMAAVRSNAYLFEPTSGLAKVNLKSNANNKDFSVSLKNLGNKDLTYKSKLVVMTNEVKDGVFTLREKTIYEKDFGTVNVNANSVVTNNYTINIDENKHNELLKEMPNGYWIDGYLFFKSDDVDVPELSIPIVGFIGEHDDIPIFEKSIYDMDVESGDVPTYYDGTDNSKTQSIHSTYLYSFIGKNRTVLGFKKDGNFINLKTRKDKIAFSPNGDGYFDELSARFVANRNFKNANLTLYTVDENGNAKDMVNHNDAGTFGFGKSGDKNAYMDRDDKPSLFPKSYSPSSGFTIRPNNRVLDGKYIARLSASPQYSDKLQNMDFPIIIDREMPRVPKIEYNEETKVAKVFVTDMTLNNQGSGIKYAYYVNKNEKDDKTKRTYVEVDDNTNIIDIKLAEGKNLEDIILVLQDWAGNKIEDDLLNLKEQVSYGKLTINTVVKDSTENVGDIQYELVNSNGEKVDNINRVKVGKYTLTIKNVPLGYKLISDKVVKINITEDNLFQTIVVTIEKIVGEKVSIQVSVNETITKEPDFTVKAIDSKGNEYVFIKGSTLNFGGNKNYYYDFILPFDEDYTINIVDNKNEFKIEPNEIKLNNFNKDSRKFFISKAYDSDTEAKSLTIKSVGLPEGIEAQYTVYDSGFNVVKDLTNLMPGKYYVEVTSIPEGYMVDATEKIAVIYDSNVEIVFNFTDVSNSKASIKFNIKNEDDIDFDINDIIVEDANGNIISHDKLEDLKYGLYSVYLLSQYSADKYKGYGLYNSINESTTRITLNKEFENAILELRLERINKSGRKIRIFVGHRDESFNDRYDKKNKLSIELVNIDGDKFDYDMSFSGFESFEVPVDYYDFNVKNIDSKYEAYFKYNSKLATGTVIDGFYPSLDIITKKKDAPESGMGRINIEFKDINGAIIDSAEFEVRSNDDKSFLATSIQELNEIPLGGYTITITKPPVGYKMPSRRTLFVTLDKLSRERTVSFVFEKETSDPEEPVPTGNGKVKLNEISFNRDFDLKDLYIVKDGSKEKIRAQKLGKGYLSYFGFENLEIGKYKFGVDENSEIAIAVELKEFEITDDNEKTINIFVPRRVEKYNLVVEGIDDRSVLKFDHYTKNYRGEEFIILTEGFASNTVKIVLDKSTIPEGKILETPENGILEQGLYINNEFKFKFVDEGAELAGQSSFQIDYVWANSGVSGVNIPFIPKYKVTKDSIDGKEFFGDKYNVYKNLHAGKYYIQITNIPEGWEVKENPVEVEVDGKAPRYGIPSRIQIRYYNSELPPANDGIITVSLSDKKFNGEINFTLKDNEDNIVDANFVRSSYIASYTARNLEFKNYKLYISAPGYKFDKNIHEVAIEPLDNRKYLIVKISEGEPETEPPIEIKYNVNFDADNGEEIRIVEVKEGEKVTEPTQPRKAGYIFKGWYNGEEKYNFEEAVTLDLNLKARWEKEIIAPTPIQPITGKFFEPSNDYFKKEEKKYEPKLEEPKKEKEEKKDYGIEVAEKIVPIAFEDVSEEQKEIVDYVTQYQIMKGTDLNKFKPNDPISRVMVVETLKRIVKDKSVSTNVKFNDVGINEWYTDSVYWAATHGYVLGDDKGNFNPNTLLTRQEFALILERFLKMNGITLEKVKEFTSQDAQNIPEWSKEAVVKMVENGLVEPLDTNNYNPTSKVTRYELARALKILIEWVQRQN